MPNCLQAHIPLSSGLNIPTWRSLLADFPDTLLVDHLEFGWSLDYTAKVIPNHTCKNHSVTADLDFHILKFINAELAHNALLGPFESLPYSPWCQQSPMMKCPKKNSRKNGGIVRGFYLGHSFNFSLPSVTTLTDKLIELGPDAWPWSADLARSHHQLRVCPLSTLLLGIALNGNTYIDVELPFGCRTSSLASVRTTCVLVWLLRKGRIF